jgi:hypothetical protein
MISAKKKLYKFEDSAMLKKVYFLEKIIIF